MSHNPNQVLLGATRSNIKEVGNRVGSVAAGLACRLKSDGTVTTAAADGSLVGISLGKDLSDTNRTAFAYKGVGVPIQLTAAFTPTLGAAVHIDDVTGKAKASGAGATAVNATYSAILSGGGLPEDGGAAIPCALIDFPGGL